MESITIALKDAITVGGTEKKLLVAVVVFQNILLLTESVFQIALKSTCTLFSTVDFFTALLDAIIAQD
jgi:hypothetical protein